MKIEWNINDEVAIDDGVWRPASPLELHLRNELWDTQADLSLAMDALVSLTDGAMESILSLRR
jgi:hypothetical protein